MLAKTNLCYVVPIIYIFFVLFFPLQISAKSFILCYDTSNPQSQFAAVEIQNSVTNQNLTFTCKTLDEYDSDIENQIVLCTVINQSITGGINPALTEKESFSIYKINSNYLIIGADNAGMMYGGLEFAELIQIDAWNFESPIKQVPYMKMRGTKFNIPLDVRTPSYTDVCDAAQQNIEEMWNMEFWKEYIDTLAQYRYNFISCWNLHPFPSLVKVPDYPEIALNDVKKSNGPFKENYTLQGKDFDAPEIMNNLVTVKSMSIDEKVKFWRDVMRYGKERNVDFYFVTWNIFTYGIEGKYGITDDISNETTRDYFRKSIKQMFLTYPDLAGIGLTTGENMENADFAQKEDWAFDTYAKGALDAANQFPDRNITLIHRQHMAGAKDIVAKFKPVIENANTDFIFSFKYAKAHVYSSTTQPYHRQFVNDIGDVKTIWTLRNDDIYFFRWGAPNFVRDFIQNIPYDVSRGYYYGSDQYIWGREFLSLTPESPRQLEIVKHWYQWSLWGRLGYNPNIPNKRWIKILQHKFPEVDGTELFEAWQHASMTYPLTTGFHWGSLDFQWYIEACKSRPGPAKTKSGFHDVNRFISLPPHPTSGNISIPKFVEAKIKKKPIHGISPYTVSNNLHHHADKALEFANRYDHSGSKELDHSIADIKSMSYLGKYYAHKIHGAIELALYRETKNKEHQQNAVDELIQAAVYWQLYFKNGLEHYKNPLWTNRVGYVDWKDIYRYVLKDIEIAKAG